VTAYTPEAKPTVLDGSASIAASAADALPMNRAAAPVLPRKAAKALARRSDAVSAQAAANVRPVAKPLKVAHVRHRVRVAHAKPLPAPTAYTRPLSASTSNEAVAGKHKRVAAAKPLSEEGDGGPSAKSAVRGKPIRAKAKREKPAADE
jgi:hypothetical protein